MGLSLKKFLYRYFGTDELKDALDAIGEKVSGNKDELVNRLVANWESHNRSIYDLLDYVDEEMLALLCDDYNIDSDGDENLLRRRIRREKLLESSFPKPSSMIDDSIHQISRIEIESKSEDLDKDKKSSEKHRISLSKIATICAIVGTIIAVLTYFGLKIP